MQVKVAFIFVFSGSKKVFYVLMKAHEKMKEAHKERVK